MFGKTSKTKGDQLVLGFDAACGKCSDMAKQIKRDAGPVLDIVPLRSPQMVSWREAIFEEPPFVPTLVRVDPNGEAKDAWIGWKIGPVLGAEMGPQKAASALRNIGEMRIASNGGQLGIMARSQTTRRGFGRLAFGIAGLAAGAATLTSMSSAAFAKGMPTDLKVSNEKNLEWDEAVKALNKQLKSQDVRNILGHTKEKSRVNTLASESNGLNLDNMEVGAKKMTLADGTISDASYAYDRDSGEMIVVQEHSEVVDGQATIAWVLDIEEKEDTTKSTFKVREKSVNGALVRRLENTVDAEGRSLMTTAAKGGKDPCGGCKGGVCKIGGEEFRKSCYSSSVVGCILSAAGCVGCAACSGTGACIFCAITSCGSVLVSCCDKESGPACERCQRVC